jgi:peptidoglycan/LPS O-acetylase OafA/YrhL
MPRGGWQRGQESRCGNVKQMSATTATTRESRLAWLDALRGFAALCVVFDHGSTLLLLPARSFLYQWVNLGQYGVFVFFLVSGYIVPASLEHKGSIVPVTVWTLSYEMVFYLLLAGLFAWGVHRRSGWYATAFAVAAVALGGVLPMALFGSWSRYGGSNQVPLNATVDVLLLVGLGLAVAARSWPAKAGATLAALVGLVLVMVNQTFPFPWSGSVILALMFTGTVIYRAEQGEFSRLAAAAITLGVLALTTFAGIWHGAQQHQDHNWQLQWATSILLAGVTFGIGLALRRARVPGWCAWLGMISYSVYLLHPLVFDAYRAIPALHRKHTMPNQVLFFAGLVAVIIGLSALTYYFVEKPMQRLGRRVAARFPYPATEMVSAESVSAPKDGAPEGAPAAAARSASSKTVVAGGSGGSP